MKKFLINLHKKTSRPGVPGKYLFSNLGWETWTQVKYRFIVNFNHLLGRILWGSDIWFRKWTLFYIWKKIKALYHKFYLRLKLSIKKKIYTETKSYPEDEYKPISKKFLIYTSKLNATICRMDQYEPNSHLTIPLIDICSEQEFLEYIDNEVKKYCKEETFKWIKKNYNEGDIKLSKEQVDYIKKNPNCYLPWTLDDKKFQTFYGEFTIDE